MNVIKVKHVTLRNGDFPTKQLEEIEGISVREEKIDTFRRMYYITIDENNLSKDETLLDVSCELGMMIQSHIELYLK